jgi:rhodanese-related sulfurtransferase
MKKILLVIFSITLNWGCAQPETVDLNVTELSTINFPQAQDSILLDVRTLREFYEGKIAGSENIDVTKTDYFTSQVRILDKSKHYFLICRSGSRSQKAATIMEDLGFTHLHNVSGGILAWQKENYPLER